MDDIEQQNITETDRNPGRWTAEKTTWWMVFGVLIVVALLMLTA